jgi:hypothetical protein
MRKTAGELDEPTAVISLVNSVLATWPRFDVDSRVDAIDRVQTFVMG